MKKIVYILLLVGIVLVAFGVSYNSIFQKKANPKITEYTGKYYKGNDTIYIYETEEKNLYFVINDNIYGKATISNDEASGIVLDHEYKFTMDDDKLVVDVNNSSIAGVYAKSGTITLEEFYNSNYGNYELLNSMYSAKYRSDLVTITICQTKDDEVIAFINKNTDKMLLKFTIRDIGFLYCVYDDNDSYLISLNDDKVLYTKEGAFEFYQEEVPFEGTITAQDVFELFIEYQQYK